MKNRRRSIGLLFIFLGVFIFVRHQLFAAELMVASFEKDGLSDMGTDIGTWSSNSQDTSQGCTMEIVSTYGVLGRETEETHILKISYDVATTGPAFNGISIKLNNMDITPYDEISFLVKGDDVKGFTTKFKIEFKNMKGERTAYVLKGISDEWQRLVVPIKEIKSAGTMRDWSNLKELRFVFDDMTVDQKNGVIYLDDIKLLSKGE